MESNNPTQSLTVIPQNQQTSHLAEAKKTSTRQLVNLCESAISNKLSLSKIIDSLILKEIRPVAIYLDGGEVEAELSSQLSMLILSTARFLQVKNVPCDADVFETVGFIIDDYKDLTFNDFVLFFTEIRKGIYGEMYENFSGQKIMIFLNKYWEKRESDLMRIHINAAQAENQKRELEQKIALIEKKESPEQKEFVSNLIKGLVSEIKETKAKKQAIDVSIRTSPFPNYVNLQYNAAAAIQELDFATDKIIIDYLTDKITKLETKLLSIESENPLFLDEQYYNSQLQLFFPNLSK